MKGWPYGEQLHITFSGHLTGHKQPVIVRSFQFADLMFHVLTVQRLRLKLDLRRQEMAHNYYD